MMYICFANTEGVVYGHQRIQNDLDKIRELNSSTLQNSQDYEDTMQDNEDQGPVVWPTTDAASFTHMGAISLNPKGIVVVDRHPQEISTQIEPTALIKTLAYLMTNFYHNFNIPIVVYLPRMAVNMLEEANIQHGFLQMMSTIKNDAISTQVCKLKPKPSVEIKTV